MESLGDSPEEMAHVLFAVLRDEVKVLAARSGSRSSHVPGATLRGAFFAPDTRFA